MIFLLILYKIVHNADKINRVTRSPRLAAIGVAILSGLMLKRFEIIITNIIKPAKMRLANEAVETLPAIRTSSFLGRNSFSVITLRTMAPTDARNPTIIA